MSSDEIVEGIANAGRARWKVENENNNVLKIKGYHLEHNFGHGQEHLAQLLVTLNLLAFLMHTILELMGGSYGYLKNCIFWISKLKFCVLRSDTFKSNALGFSSRQHLETDHEQFSQSLIAG